MSKLIVSTIETQNIETQNVKFDSDTTAFTIGSNGSLSDISTTNFKFSASAITTVSSQVSSIDISVPAGVTEVRMVYNDLSAASAGEMAFRVSTNGSFLTSGYVAGSIYVNSSTTQGTTNYTGQLPIAYGYNNVANSFNGHALFACTTLNSWAYTSCCNSAGYPAATLHAAGKIDLGSSNTLDAIRVYALGGNIDAGVVRCYFQ
tara:strand:+ start:821 stop:1432 length:612 start_codon:yes stop_codon:yes gene_type:complete